MSTKPSIKRSFDPFDALAAVFVLALAGLLFLLFYGGRGDALTATVIHDSETVAVYTLPALREDVLLTPEGLAYPLTIRIASGGAEVVESSCPTLDCQHTGHISRSGESIICLPNKLVIRLSGGESDAPDAALG